MLLALFARDLHQRAGLEAAGLGQHVAGHRDFIVPCEALNHARRRKGNRRKALAEVGPRAAFDPGDQQAHDVVEHLDLFLVEARPVMQEQVGHLPQRFDPLCRRTGSDRVLEFGDDGVIRL